MLLRWLRDLHSPQQRAGWQTRAGLVKPVHASRGAAKPPWFWVADGARRVVGRWRLGPGFASGCCSSSSRSTRQAIQTTPREQIPVLGGRDRPGRGRGRPGQARKERGRRAGREKRGTWWVGRNRKRDKVLFRTFVPALIWRLMVDAASPIHAPSAIIPDLVEMKMLGWPGVTPLGLARRGFRVQPTFSHSHSL